MFHEARQGVFWLIGGEERDAPCVLMAICGAADLGGAGLSGDGEIWDFESCGAAVGVFHRLDHGVLHQLEILRSQEESFPDLWRSVPEDLSVLGLDPLDQIWPVEHSAVGEGGGIECGLEGRDGDGALSDGGVCGIDCQPIAFPEPLCQGSFRGDSGGVAQFQPRAFAESGLVVIVPQDIDAHLHSQAQEKGIAGDHDGAGEIQGAMSVAPCAANDGLSHREASVAEGLLVGDLGDFLQSGEGHQWLHDGAGSVGALCGAVEHRAVLVVLEHLRERRGIQVIQGERGSGGHGHHGAGLNLHRHQRAGVSRQRRLGGGLCVDVDREHQVLSVLRLLSLVQSLSGVSHGIHQEELHAGATRQFLVEGLFQAAAPPQFRRGIQSREVLQNVVALGLHATGVSQHLAQESREGIASTRHGHDLHALGNGEVFAEGDHLRRRQVLEDREGQHGPPSQLPPDRLAVQLRGSSQISRQRAFRGEHVVQRAGLSSRLSHFGDIEDQVVAILIFHQRLSGGVEDASADAIDADGSQGLPSCAALVFRAGEDLHLPETEEHQQEHQQDHAAAEERSPPHDLLRHRSHDARRAIASIAIVLRHDSRPLPIGRGATPPGRPPPPGR